MKIITAENFYALVNNALLAGFCEEYWSTKTNIKIEYVAESESELSDHTSFGGYQPKTVSPKKMTEHKTQSEEHNLHVAKLLAHHNYQAAIFPLVFSQSHLINLDGCSNQFEALDFNDELFADLVWCLTKNLIEANVLTTILSKMSVEYKHKLYQSNIPRIYKDILFSNFPSCDHRRKVLTHINNLFESAAWNNDTSEDNLEHINAKLNTLQKMVHAEKQHLQNNEFLEFTKKIADLKKSIAEFTFNNNYFFLAEKMYDTLISESKNKKSAKDFYLTRGFCLYMQNKLTLAMKDFKCCEKYIDSDDATYNQYRGLTRLAQSKYKRAAHYLCNVNLTQNPDMHLLHNYVVSKLTPIELENFLDALAKEPRYHSEYRNYLHAAAKNNIGFAFFRLYEMAKESDPSFSQYWSYLNRAAELGHPPAQHKLAQYYLTMNQNAEHLSEQNLQHNYKVAKTSLTKSASGGYEPARKIMYDFLTKRAESFKSDSPMTDASQKRKVLEASSKAHEEKSDSPPVKLARKAPSDMDLYLSSKKSNKSVRIPDTTFKMAELVEAAYSNDKDDKKRNYIAANLTFIFSDPENPGQRSKRYVRTVAIRCNTQNVKKNIENFYQTSAPEIDQKLQKSHKDKINKAVGVHATLANNGTEEIGLLQFIPATQRKNYASYKYKDSENALYEYLCIEENLKKIVADLISRNKDILLKKAKFYGVVLDIYSIYSSCTDCRKLTITMQNRDYFLEKLQKILESEGFVCLTRRQPGLWQGSKLYFQIRIRASRNLKNKTDVFADQDIVPKQKDIQKLNNALFFHKVEKPAETVKTSDENHIIFTSGTYAKRSKKS